MVPSSGGSTDRATEYACASCGLKGAGLYISGGWWRYPVGWFVHDNADQWACSERCAKSVSSVPPPPMPVR
jgi:hypothetical protein